MNRGAGLFACFVALLSAAVLYAGPVDQTVATHDLFGLIEGGWKIVHGARPYIDFYTLLGPLSHLIMAGSFLLTGPATEAFPVGIVVTLLPVAALAWHVMSSRLSLFFRLLAATYLALVWTAPFPLHYQCNATAYAMLYNRQSYVLLSILMVAILGGGPREPILIGVLFGLLLFFKAPYGLAAGILIGFGALRAWPSRRESLRAFGGFIAVALPIILYLRPAGLTSMLSTFYLSGRARSPDIYQASVGLLLRELPLPFILTSVAVCCLWILGAAESRAGVETRPASFGGVRLWVEVLVVALVVIVTEMGSSWLGTLYDVPLLAVYGIMLADRTFAERVTPLAKRRPLALAVGITCCLSLIVPLWFRCFLGTFLTVEERAHPLHYPGSSSIDAPDMKDIRMCFSCGIYPDGITYAAKINDGLSLLRRHPELNGLIATLEFTDSFSFPLGRKSPPHMPLWIQYGANVGKDIYPDPQFIFTGCEGLMVPKYQDSDYRAVPLLLKRYHAFIQENFPHKDTSSAWTLYFRDTAL